MPSLPMAWAATFLPSLGPSSGRNQWFGPVPRWGDSGVSIVRRTLKPRHLLPGPADRVIETLV
jgi:hypothetical protein